MILFKKVLSHNYFFFRLGYYQCWNYQIWKCGKFPAKHGWIVRLQRVGLSSKDILTLWIDWRKKEISEKKITFRLWIYLKFSKQFSFQKCFKKIKEFKIEIPRWEFGSLFSRKETDRNIKNGLKVRQICIFSYYPQGLIYKRSILIETDERDLVNERLLTKMNQYATI